MYFWDLINLSFQSQCTIDLCPGSAFNSITAALASQGYYKQADLLYYLTGTELSSLAALIYAISAFAGIVSMVLGAPPRNYMWFFIGPGIYSFLVATTTHAKGVRWMDMGHGLTPANQAEVWRIAEPGLRNNSYIIRNGIAVHGDKAPTGGTGGGGTDGTAEVSYFFVWIDYFFSSLMEQLIPLTGIYYLEEGSGADSNIDKMPGQVNKNWSILTDDKWTKVLDITDAHLSNTDLRESFVTFLAGECGDVYHNQIDNALWLAATKGRGDRIPVTVFKGAGTNRGRAEALTDALATKAVPIPDSLVALLSSGFNSYSGSSFLDSSTDTRALLDQIESDDFSGGITCDEYLRVVVHGFKYEAVNIYSQLIDDAPGEFRDDPKSVVRNLLYGWGINKLTAPSGGNMNDPDVKRREYLVNLIFVYLLRNELAIAPKPLDLGTNSSSERVQSYVDIQVRTVGSKTKYAEIYSWAKMMPYFQGIMMYVLAMAYPFIALMVIVPGWHKIIVTWITFWIWVKSWDLGFAIVKVLERSIWAMLGNDPSAAYTNQQVLNVGEFIPYTPGCANGVEIGNCGIPTISFGAGSSAGSPGPMETLDNTFIALGRALGLAGNLDLDLTNSYYIYIMAALYFAVPGVTGQLVLGAKSGAANLVGGAIQGFGDANKGAAGSGAQSHLANAIQSNMGAIGQASYAKASKAISADGLEAQNLGHSASLAGQAMNTKNQLASTMGGAYERRNQSLGSQVSAVENAGVVAGLAAKTVAGGIGAVNQGNGGAEKLKLGMRTVGDGEGGGASSPAGASSPTDAGGGAGGGAPGGSNRLLPMYDTAKEVAGKLSKMDKVAVASTAEMKNRAAQPVMAAVNDINAMGSDRSISGFAAQGQSTQYGNDGQRLGQFAGYSGETGASRASMRMANQMGAYASIAGGLMGGSMVRQLPTANEGSAMSGILNSYSSDGSGGANKVTDAQAKANFFQPDGAFAHKITGHVNGMQSMNGRAVDAAYGGGHTGDLQSLKDSDFERKDTSSFR